MLVDLLDKLIDRCIQLVKHEKAMRRELFDDFVDPALKELESVHAAYLGSFDSYREKIQSAETLGTSLKMLSGTIQKDSLFSAGDRAKLKTLADAAPPPMTGEFFVTIRAYLNELVTVQDGDPAGDEIFPDVPALPRNYYRRQLMEELRSLSRKRSPSPEGKKEAAIHILDGLVAEMQTRYTAVLTEYAILKNNLMR